MLQRRMMLPTYDPFVAPRRWLLRLGSRFYYPIAAAVVATIVGIVIFDTFISHDLLRRVADLMLIGVACLLVLYWRVERMWLRGEQNLLVRLMRPDWAFVWSGMGVVMVALGLVVFIQVAGPSSVGANHLWPLFLFPLLFLSERGDTLPFLFILGVACVLLILVRLAVDNSLAGALTPPLWLATLASSNYYLARRFLLTELRTELIRQVANQLSVTPDIENSYPAIAKLIAQRLRYENVQIWIAEQNHSTLVLRAAHGSPPELWQGVAVAANEGILGLVAQERHPEGWNNVQDAPHYQPIPGFEWVVSLLAVPIVVGEHMVGVLAVLSRNQAEFWELDIGHLTVMADSIGIAIARSQHVRAEAERLRDTLAQGIRRVSECEEPGEMFAAIAQEARDNLGADLVVLYQLAPGTGYPLLPPFYEGDFHMPEAMDAPGLPDDSALFDLLERGLPYYSADAQHDPLLTPAGKPAKSTDRQRFIVREGVRSTAFLPVGEPGERVGALFLHHRSPQEFSPQTQLTLEAFATVVAEQINRERRKWQRFIAFGGKLFGVHGSLMVSADALRRFIGSAREMLHTDSERAAQALKHASAVAAKLEFMAMLHRLGNRDQVGRSGLRVELRRAATKITQYVDPLCRLHFDVPPEVDELPLELLDVLYCLAVEAVANAAVHGRARRIDITVEIAPRSVDLSVADNGQGFDATRTKHGPDGIFEGLELAQAQFGAQGQVVSRPGAGARVEVCFPHLEEDWAQADIRELRTSKTLQSSGGSMSLS